MEKRISAGPRWTRFAVIPLAILVLGHATPSSSGAQDKASIIDTFIRTLAERGQFNGSVLVAERGRSIYKGAFGMADVRHGRAFSPATPCYLASLTKQFTAMAIMKLVESRKLSYDTPLSDFFAEFPAYARAITIRHLLTHTSGIPDYVGLGVEHPGVTDQEVLGALVRQDSLRFAPGDRFEYSNSNYVLLALIVERASGQPYARFLEKSIFGPLGMQHTFVDDSLRPALEERAKGYNRFGDDADYDLLTYGEGGIYSTVEDLFLWDQALYTEKLVSAATLAEAFAGAKLHDGRTSGYGFGWAIGTYNAQPTTSHAGRYGGFNTYIKRFLNDRNVIIFLTNRGFRNMSAIGNALTNILYGKPYTLPALSVADAMFERYSSNGLPAAMAFYRSVLNTKDTTYDGSESELNELGYELLGMKRFPDAIEILTLNAEAYPGSSNVYDGLGEAYMDNGDRELAILNYRKSLALDPGNSNAVAMLKRLGAR